MRAFKVLSWYWILSFLPGLLFAQDNVGIGTTNPTEKLEVSGIVYTNSGGIRFPDQTLQETAAFNDNGPEDASTPNGQVYVTISTVSPAINDTIWLYAISSGGVNGAISGATTAVPFIMVKESDTTSVRLFQKSVLNTSMAYARIHFTTSSGFLYQTIELDNVSVEDIGFRLVYLGNNEYAHLEEFELAGYLRMEITRFGPGTDPCYCWDFSMGNFCACD